MDFRAVKWLIVGDEENRVSRVMEMHSSGDMFMPGLRNEDGGDGVIDPRYAWIAAHDEIGICQTRAEVVIAVVVVAQGEGVHPVNFGS